MPPRRSRSTSSSRVRMPAHEPLERGRLVRRVVVDVHLREARVPLDDEVDQPLERALLAGQRDVGRLVGVERPDGRELAVDVDHAEEVVDAVVERVRVALEVEEQVAGDRAREGWRARARDRSARPAWASSSSWIGFGSAATLDLDAGLLAHALDAGCARPVEWRVERDRRRGQSHDGVQLAGDERLALPGGDAGDEREVVVSTPSQLAQLGPAADVAMLDRLGVGRGRRVDGAAAPARRTSRDRLLEARFGRPVSTPCSRRRAGGAVSRALPPSTTFICSGCTPWILVSCSTYEQIWSTAPALTWRASFVSATS